MDNAGNIGKVLRDTRTRKGLSLKELATRSGLSASFLSNVERGLNSPTVSSLWRICQALDTTLVELFSPTDQSDIMVRRADRLQVVSSRGSTIKYELAISGHGKNMHAVCITLDPGADYGGQPRGHPGDEIGFVLRGTLEMEVAGRKYVLGEGDAIYIAEGVPHRYANRRDEPCISLWVVNRESHITV